MPHIEANKHLPSTREGEEDPYQHTASTPARYYRQGTQSSWHPARSTQFWNGECTASRMYVREARDKQLDAQIEPALKSIEGKMDQSQQKKRLKIRMQSDFLKQRNEEKFNLYLMVKQEEKRQLEERRKALEKNQRQRI